MFVVKRLIEETRRKRPDLYESILSKIRPYSLDSVLELFAQHVQKSIHDIRIFNLERDKVPEYCWDIIRHMKFPEPGDAIGINIVCRVTKSDTQGALDSKHLQNITNSYQYEFNVEKDILDELSIFSNHMQIFELANRHKYATIFMNQDVTTDYLIHRLPRAGILERGRDFNKGRNECGGYEYLSAFQYVLVDDRGSVKVLYKSVADLYGVLLRVPLHHIFAFSDIRCVYKRCGPTIAFFNMIHVAKRQLFVNDNSRYEKDITTLLTFMFFRKELLPMNREGLARNEDRTPVDVFSFEAMKRNASKMVTGKFRERWHERAGSSDNILFGMQPVEGTGYNFALRSRYTCTPPETS